MFTLASALLMAAALGVGLSWASFAGMPRARAIDGWRLPLLQPHSFFRRS